MKTFTLREISRRKSVAGLVIRYVSCKCANSTHDGVIYEQVEGKWFVKQGSDWASAEDPTKASAIINRPIAILEPLQ